MIVNYVIVSEEEYFSFQSLRHPLEAWRDFINYLMCGEQKGGRFYISVAIEALLLL